MNESESYWAEASVVTIEALSRQDEEYSHCELHPEGITSLSARKRIWDSVTVFVILVMRYFVVNYLTEVGVAEEADFFILPYACVLCRWSRGLY